MLHCYALSTVFGVVSCPHAFYCREFAFGRLFVSKFVKCDLKILQDTCFDIMALPIPKSGYSRFMKEGARHFKGADEAVLRNVEACIELSSKLRTAFGPNGMNKMVINHIEKLFVTNDAATILNELEIQHPAARLLVLAAQMQEKQVGDYTNTVIMFAADLLERAASLLHMGLKPVEVADAYDQAFRILETQMPNMVSCKATDLNKLESVQEYLKSSIASKQFEYQEFITELVAKACVQTVPKNSANFNVDNIRVCKILGSGVQHSRVMNGMVFKRGAEGTVRSVTGARVAVYSCPFDITQTETKGTVLMNNAEELKTFSGNEEVEIEAAVKALHDSGVTCVVAAGKFGDLYLHFLNKFNIMAVRLTSKFDLRRLCKSIGAHPQSRICVPSVDLLGQCDRIYLEEIGDTNVTVFDKESERGNISTIIIRGSSQSRMDDVERAIDDAVNTYKALTKDDRLVAGAGSIDMRLSMAIEKVGTDCVGVEQYGILKYALALSMMPKQLAKNNGYDPSTFMSCLITAHKSGKDHSGIDLNTGEVMDAVEGRIFDLYAGKLSAYRLATEAVSTILRVDQIIMAKQATGGPKPRNPLPQDGGDDGGMA
ncbi:hypothetical protein L596_005128 [Steinernema carpocapsae]|uniref:T-complex protein 1 subunit theta n=1 Tax=Steinernema carpocapsae TaxID=34508 RepID=A0A4U8UY45_STECR|nr:hypothetical protein L596_005128 [Steinernema carpocapsae]